MTSNHSKIDSPKLSIIVPTYKSYSSLKIFLKNTLDLNLPFPYEIIVIDDASNDGTDKKTALQFPNVTVLSSQKNRGFSASVNSGLRYASGEYVLIMNPDIIIERKSIEKMIAFYEKHREKIGILTAKLIDYNGKTQHSCYGFFQNIREILSRRTPIGKFPLAQKTLDTYLLRNWNHDSVRSIAWTLGSCMLIERKKIETVGYMDERFFMYMEDVDFCRRFWQKGYQVIYYPHAKMLHYHKRSSDVKGIIKAITSNRMTRIHIKSAIKYFLKYFGGREPVITPFLSPKIS